ncbi:MAG TPA: dimethylmenaquinone methyltransferase [Bryobacteraceae bacterium]|nr:dimethylmenaquinone methyltransferase [Bryobacteraceae bacterium]
MRYVSVLLLTAVLSLPACGQLFRLNREQMIRYTTKNPFERFPDGRPKVPASLLAKVKDMSLEEAWGILQSKGYHHQYVNDLEILHPGQKLVGRAFTAQYLPMRPDLAEALAEDAKAQGLPSSTNQKTIDQLQLDDVPVIDLMGVAPGHNYGGDNLQTAVWAATHTGAVIDGTIRDLDGIFELPSQLYFRQANPTPVGEVVVIGINIPVKVGHAIVMPGDVVLGDREGVIFIPPHLVQEIVDAADLTHIHDEWTKMKLLTGKYKSSQIYTSALSPELQADYDAYVKKRRAEMKK